MPQAGPIKRDRLYREASDIYDAAWRYPNRDSLDEVIQAYRKQVVA